MKSSSKELGKTSFSLFLVSEAALRAPLADVVRENRPPAGTPIFSHVLHGLASTSTRMFSIHNGLPNPDNIAILVHL